MVTTPGCRGPVWRPGTEVETPSAARIGTAAAARGSRQVVARRRPRGRASGDMGAAVAAAGLRESDPTVPIATVLTMWAGMH
jgi:hypothetical protein